MKEKIFILRVDLESDKGIKAIPRLLDLLKRYEIKASFYLVMGGESGIIDLLKYRKKLTGSEEREIKVWNLKQKLRIAILPKDFVKENEKILERILREGHELGLHGWKHREWTRGLNKIKIDEKVSKAKNRYFRLFGKEAISFAVPGFNTNEKVLKVLKNQGIRFISDFQGEKPDFYCGIKNVPITICGKNRTPIIEYLSGKGKSDAEIFDYIKKEIKDKIFASFYIHGLFEARFKLNILEEIFKFIKKHKIQNRRIIDL